MKIEQITMDNEIWKKQKVQARSISRCSVCSLTHPFVKPLYIVAEKKTTASEIRIQPNAVLVTTSLNKGVEITSTVATSSISWIRGKTAIHSESKKIKKAIDSFGGGAYCKGKGCCFCFCSAVLLLLVLSSLLSVVAVMHMMIL